MSDSRPTVLNSAAGEREALAYELRTLVKETCLLSDDTARRIDVLIAAISREALPVATWNVAIEAAAKEADHWDSIPGNGNRSGAYIAGAIRGLKREPVALSNAPPDWPELPGQVVGFRSEVLKAVVLEYGRQCADTVRRREAPIVTSATGGTSWLRPAPPSNAPDASKT